MKPPLYHAHRLGRWSFTETPPAGVVNLDGLLRVSVDPWDSRSWTISLNEWRYSGGTIVAGRPPQNQVDSRFVKARITWGTDGSSETALVDWYVHGNTVQVNASMVSVDIVCGAQDNPANPTPTLSGCLSPAQSWRANQGQSPTFTPINIVLPALTNQLVPVPCRATAYRWYSVSSLSAGDLVFRQLSRDGVAVIRIDNFGAAFGSATGNDMDAAAGYYPLHPSTQFVQVENQNAVSLFALGVEFLLDLS